MSAKKKSTKKKAPRAARPAGEAAAPPAPEPKPPRAQAPPRLPELGDRVLYREPAPDDTTIERAAFVIAIAPDGCAALSVLTIVPRTTVTPTPGSTRLALGVRYSREAIPNTWFEARRP